jgi:hypothetical protein
MADINSALPIYPMLPNQKYTAPAVSSTPAGNTHGGSRVHTSPKMAELLERFKVADRLVNELIDVKPMQI